MARLGVTTVCVTNICVLVRIIIIETEEQYNTINKNDKIYPSDYMCKYCYLNIYSLSIYSC